MDTDFLMNENGRNQKKITVQKNYKELQMIYPQGCGTVTPHPSSEGCTW